MFLQFPEVDLPIQGAERVRLPEMVPVRQEFDRRRLEKPGESLADALERKIPKVGFAGKRIAVTVGSRGIPHLAELTGAICAALKRRGAAPFVVPAMGSHGGASAQGQVELLSGYGVTESALGVPVLASMEAIPYTDLDGVPLYCDKLAYESDGIVVFNKVKPHTEFRGEHESGLAKMIAIGLGNHLGATSFHSFGFQRFAELLPRAAQAFLDTGKLAFGVGVVQNAYDELSDLAVCTAEDFLETDRALLRTAKDKLARFLFDRIDLLIIDEIGKNISGTGCDPNVVGRNLSGTFQGILDLQKLFIRGLTPESHHSGVGLGMADITTRSCLNDVDWAVTWTNVLTTGSMQGGHIPLYANSDQSAILQCIATCHNADPARPRIVRIRNTLSLDEIQVSAPLFEAIRDLPGIRALGPSAPMDFDRDGNLSDIERMNTL